MREGDPRQQVPRAGALGIDEAREGAADDVEEIVDRAAHDPAFRLRRQPAPDRLVPGRGKADDAGPGNAGNIAAHHAIPQFGHHQQAARMFVAAPDGEGSAPFLEARAEILRAVDRVEHRAPLPGDRSAGPPAFLADEGQIVQVPAKQPRYALFQIDVGGRDRAAVRLPHDVVAALFQGGQRFIDEAGDVAQKGSNVGHIEGRPAGFPCDFRYVPRPQQWRYG